MGVTLTRRPFITAAPLVLGGMGAMCFEARNAATARADEVTTDEVTEETARYINYLDGLQFEELATVAFTEDGYWGTATTMVWQKFKPASGPLSMGCFQRPRQRFVLCK